MTAVLTMISEQNLKLSSMNIIKYKLKLLVSLATDLRPPNKRKTSLIDSTDTGPSNLQTKSSDVEEKMTVENQKKIIS